MVVAVPAAHAQAPGQISLPDLTAETPGTSITVPITLDAPLTTSDNVLSYTIKIDYDPAVIDITGIDDTGTLTDGWSSSVNTGTSGRINATAITTTALVASGGTLVNLNVTLLGSAGSSALAFTDDTFLGDYMNGSDLAATDGNVSTGNALVITEVHADPAPAPTGDANNDGTTDTGDQFVEIVNTGSQAIDLTGYLLFNGQGTLLYTFGSVTLAPGVALTAFSGGSPTGIPGEVLVAIGLGLDAGGGSIELQDASGNRVDGVTWGEEASNDASVTRAPGLTDAFVIHTQTTSGAPYSPGATPGGTALPVELGTWRVMPDGSDLIVAWSTISETQNAGFGVEMRRADGNIYEEAAFVRGAGTTTQRQDYRVRLRDLAPGTYSIRLRQVDVDGTPVYTSPRSAVIEMNGRFVHRPASPNPFRGRAVLELQVRETQPVRVDLYNTLGQRVQTVFTGTLRAGAAPTEIAIDGHGLASGLYLYRITGSTFATTGRLTRVR